MTKSDFERIARALRGSFVPTTNDVQAIASALNQLPTTIGDTMVRERRQQWQNDVQAIASALSESNPRFDRARFLLACGMTTGADDPTQPTASEHRCANCEIELWTGEAVYCRGCKRLKELESKPSPSQPTASLWGWPRAESSVPMSVFVNYAVHTLDCRKVNAVHPDETPCTCGLNAVLGLTPTEN